MPSQGQRKNYKKPWWLGLCEEDDDDDDDDNDNNNDDNKNNNSFSRVYSFKTNQNKTDQKTEIAMEEIRYLD